jgi:type IV secretory pathway ATPase VirB11/archaellum biosynthesis ATPase
MKFGDALRASLREAPDVILVGELRDQETMAICLQAAETGHLGVLDAAHGQRRRIDGAHSVDVPAARKSTGAAAPIQDAARHYLAEVGADNRWQRVVPAPLKS